MTEDILLFAAVPCFTTSGTRVTDINLTMNVYTDVVLENQAVAVELLPELPTLLPTPAPIKTPGIHQKLAKMR